MLFDEVCKRLDLQEKDYFSLSYLDDNQTRVSDRPPSLLCHDLCGLDELFCEQFVMEMLISVFPQIDYHFEKEVFFRLSNLGVTH